MSQEVEVKIKVDTGQAVTDVNKLGNAFDNTAKDAEEAQKSFSKAGNGVQVEQSIAGLKQLKRELKGVAVGSEEFKKLYNDIDDLEDKLKSAKNTSSDWVDSLEQAGGPIGMLGAGLNKAKVATQSFGGALKATGIGLVVSLIGGLVAAFQNNENAMKKLQPLLDGIGKVFQGVFRAVEPLFNTLVDLAVGALPMVSKAFGVVYSSVTAVFQSLGMIGGAIKKLLSGDFSGAWKDAKSSVNDFSSNYDKSVKRFNDGTKEMSKTESEEAEKRAEARRKAQEKRNADQEKAKQDAIAKAQAEADALKKIEEQKLADQMASAQAVMDKEKELREAQETPAQKEQREYEEWLAKYQENNLNTDLLEKEHQDFLNTQKADADALKLETETKAEEDAKSKRDKQLQDEKDLEAQKLQVKLKALDDLQTIFGAESKIGKMALLAKQALMARELIMEVSKTITFSAQAAARSTVAIAEGTAQTAKVGFPQNIPLLIGYAAQAAGIYSAIKGALSSAKASGILTPSASIGGSISAPSSAQPAINVVGASSTNAIAQTIAQQGQQPVKAYVVANDVTTQQGLDRNIVSSATLG